MLNHLSRHLRFGGVRLVPCFLPCQCRSLKRQSSAVHGNHIQGAQIYFLRSGSIQLSFSCKDCAGLIDIILDLFDQGFD